MFWKSNIDKEEQRLKNIKILTPIKRPVKELVATLIRQHEKKFLYEGKKVPIEYMRLNSKKDFQDFVKEKEDNTYKLIKDAKWGNTWKPKVAALTFMNNMKKLSKTAEFQVKNSLHLLKKKKFSKRTLQNMIAITSWHFTGYLAYEVFPLGENPYEPSVTLLEVGYVPRRLKDKWLIGYSTNE